MGQTEKQEKHDLREIEPCSQILLQQKHPKKGPWPEIDLQVCSQPQWKEVSNVNCKNFDTVMSFQVLAVYEDGEGTICEESLNILRTGHA